MSEYLYELWLGRHAEGYWNWHIKGVSEDDYKGKAELCDEYIEELQSIKAYYEGWEVKNGNNTSNRKAT